ncbi:MAG: hypothetical protein Q9195_005709 [Heterodermia aff. obscurata]
MECGFVGNADIYGIGIRIGYYSQAFAVWFATYFHFFEAEVLRDVNKLFLFALVVAGLIYASKARETYAVEPFLLLQIGINIGLVSIMDSRRYRSRYSRTSAERLISRSSIITAGLLLNVCFWWRGLDVMLATPCNGSEPAPGENKSATFIWFFAKVSIYGRMRTFGRLASLWTIIIHALTLGFADAVELLQAWRMRKTRESFVAAVATYRESKRGGECVLNSSTVPPQSSNNPVDPVVRQEDAIAREELGQNSHSLVGPPQECTKPPNPEANTRETHSNTRPIPERSRRSLKIFHGVLEAEKFLDSILSIYIERSAPLGKKRLIRTLGGYVSFHVPQSRYEHNGPQCKLSEGVWAWLMLRWSKNISISQVWAVEMCAYKLGESNFGRLRRYSYRLLQLTKKSRPPDWEMLKVASDVKLSQIPLAKSARSWAGLAMQEFVILVFLILQVELTIAWNDISGLQRITTLGQLIPFILGVGGLIKVLWGKAWLLWNGVRENRDMDPRLPGDYELAMEQYLLWKDTQGDPPAPQPCPDLLREPREPDHQST